jgi:hypothetical protein
LDVLVSPAFITKGKFQSQTGYMDYRKLRVGRNEEWHEKEQRNAVVYTSS